MKIRATAAIMECLLEQEVDTVFGYPGGTILNVYDELYRYQDKIRHILTAHEQGRPTRRTATPGLPGRSACASPPPAPGPQT